jgi:hypothetical protein
MAKPLVEIGRYGSVGLELVLTILILGGIGHWLDQRYWKDAGWATGIGFVLGVAVGFRNLVRTASRMQRDIEKAEANDPEAGKWKVDRSWLHDNAEGDEDADRDTHEVADTSAIADHRKEEGKHGPN